MTVHRVRRCKPLLGTFVEVTVAGDADESTLLAWAGEALDAVRDVHRLMSFQDPHSELSCLNATAHRRPMLVHPWTSEVLRCACAIGAQSHGAFDVAVRSGNGGSFRDIVFNDDGTVTFCRPLTIDLGGIAKGFAVDLAVELLARHPVSYACVNAGGDLRVAGDAPGVVDIRDPAQPRGRSHRVPLTHAAAATSASYYRRGGDEVLRPGLREPVSTEASVTIFAHTCMVADALTKVVLLAGPQTSTRVLALHEAVSIVLDPLPATP
ncbi:MAG TPA: FAD:protein FMN transferase [Kiritimatiellia bacterium]